MKKIILSCFAFISIAYAQNIDSAWVVNNYTKTEVMIPMRDGVKLFTSIYEPKNTSEAHPVLLTRTPYSCAPYGEKYRPDFWTSYYKMYLTEGYIFVKQDVRGRYMSEGEFEDVRPHKANKKANETDESSDTYDTIEWLTKNLKNNNGKVGTFGISYPGFYTTMTAVSNHPALKAVSPQAPVTDWFIGDDFHHNGAFMLIDGFSFYRNFGVPRPKPVQVYNKGYEITETDRYKYFLESGALPTFTGKYLGDSIKFWNDLMNHPNYDAWWKARDARRAMKNVQPDVMVVGGLFDAEDCWGAWNLYKAIEKQNPGKASNRIVMGPWFHGGWGGRSDGANLGKVKFGSKTSEWYQKNIEFPFFQKRLKGKTTTDAEAEATVFITGKNEWKNFETWPPTGVKTKTIYMQQGSKLAFKRPRPLGYREKPTEGMMYSSYTSDPANPVPHEGTDTIKSRTREYMANDQRFASKRPDVLTFTSATLTNDLTLTGSVIADLFMSSNTTDFDIVVKLIDVFPGNISETKGNSPDTVYYGNDTMNNYQMLVRGEVLRGKFRNSFENPEPFVPNKITKVNFTLPDVAHTFLKGHKIMIQVQSSWFPLVDRNPQKFTDIYKAKESDFQKANIRLYHTEGTASKVIFQVLDN
jgi:uncharacterized protein